MKHEERVDDLIYMDQRIFIGEFPIDEFSKMGWRLLFYLYGAKVSMPRSLSEVYTEFAKSYTCSSKEFQNAVKELSSSDLVEIVKNKDFETIRYLKNGPGYEFHQDAYMSIISLDWVPVILITLYLFYTFTLENCWIVDAGKLRIIDGQIHVSNEIPLLFENSEMSIEKAIKLMYHYSGTSFLKTYIDKNKIRPGRNKYKVNLDQEPKNDYAVVLHPGISRRDLNVEYKDRLISIDDLPFYKG